MNSTHDLGGMHGFGPIDRDQVALFAEEWEEKVFGMTLACGMLGQWNLDQSRFARERMDPGQYLTSTYYEHWLHGLELLLVERGVVSVEELRSGMAADPGTVQGVKAEQVPGILGKGAKTSMGATTDPVFSIGEKIRVRNFHPETHTRAPRYTRGRQGIVSLHHGAHIFPDEHAQSGDKQAEHLYNVRFEAEELWGKQDMEGKSAVYLDLFEPYLEAPDERT